MSVLAMRLMCRMAIDSAFYHVALIVLVVSQVQVIWPNTRLIVAPMQNVSAISDGAVLQDPGHSMSLDLLPLSAASEIAVAADSGGCPEPTIGRHMCRTRASEPIDLLPEGIRLAHRSQRHVTNSNSESVPVLVK